MCVCVCERDTQRHKLNKCVSLSLSLSVCMCEYVSVIFLFQECASSHGERSATVPEIRRPLITQPGHPTRQASSFLWYSSYLFLHCMFPRKEKTFGRELYQMHNLCRFLHLYLILVFFFSVVLMLHCQPPSPLSFSLKLKFK